MKAIVVFPILILLGTFQVDSLSETELVGRWRIEAIRVIRPGICIQSNPERMVGSELEFTDEYVLIFIPKGEQQLDVLNKRATWSIHDTKLLLKNDKMKAPKAAKYHIKGNLLTLQITNLIELSLKSI